MSFALATPGQLLCACPSVARYGACHPVGPRRRFAKGLRSQLAVYLFLLFSTPALMPAQEKSPPALAENVLEQERQAILSLDQAFGRAAQEGDPNRLRSLIADDGIFLGQTVRRGRVAFYAEWSAIFKPRTDVQFEWEPLEVGVAGSGDLGYSIGRVQVRWSRGRRQRESFERDGHYLSIWRKNSQGAWKIAASGTLAAHPEGTYGFGRERLRGLAEVWPPLAALDVSAGLEWEPEIVREASSGEVAFTFGRYTVTTRQGQETRSGSGGYLTLWRKDDKGFWVVAAEAFSPPL